MLKKVKYLIITWVSLWIATTGYAKTPADISAKVLQYLVEKKKILASGDVHITWQTKHLTADIVLYDMIKQEVMALGHVTLNDATTKHVLTANHLTMSGDFKNGLIDGLTLKLNDGSRLIAAKGTRADGTTNTLKDADFTPCNTICANGKTKTPLWSISANTVTHYTNDKIVYDNATLHVLDVPVFWVPEFSHPAPEVHRKSGLLSPKFSQNKERGLLVKTPYYYTFSPSQDMIIAPIVTSKAGSLLQTNYRGQFNHASLNLINTIGRVETRDFNRTHYSTIGHIKATGRMDWNEQWRTVAQLQRSSDRAVLRRFDLDGQDVLDSYATTERFDRDNWFMVQTLAFQNLRLTENNDTTPLVLPEVRYSWLGAPLNNTLGGRFFSDSDVRLIHRRDGANSRRLGSTSGWQQTHYLSNGGYIKTDVGADTAIYQIDSTNGTNTEQGRFLPFAKTTYQHALVNTSTRLSQTLTPMVGTILTTNTHSSANIANDSSQDLVLDDISLWHVNPYAGTDRTIGGSRVIYGVQYGLAQHDDTLSMDTFLGQSWRFNTASDIPSGSGLDHRLSDYVTKTSLNWRNIVNITNRMRIDQHNFKMQRNDIAVEVIGQAIQVQADYFYNSKQTNLSFGRREEAAIDTSLLLNDNWLIGGQFIRDIADNSNRSASIGLGYYNQCIGLRLDLERAFTNDGTQKPNTTAMLRLDFQHLGSTVQEYWRTKNRLDGRRTAGLDPSAN
jgi:LPS-assembly protein